MLSRFCNWLLLRQCLFYFFSILVTVLVMTAMWPPSPNDLKLAKRCVVSDHLHCSFSNVHGSQGPWVVLEKASTLLKSPWKLKKIAQVLEKSLNFLQWPLNRIEGFLNNWNFSNATLSCTQGTLKAQEDSFMRETSCETVSSSCGDFWCRSLLLFDIP